MSDERPVLHIQARDVPVPTSVSAEAQAVLSMPPLPATVYPALEDIAGWKAYVAAQDEAIEQRLGEHIAEAPVTITTLDVEGVTVYEITPDGLSEGDERVYLDIHGGAFICGGGDACRIIAVGTAQRNQMRVWAVDYRMPPDHPFPAGLDDCLRVYRALLTKVPSTSVVVGGASAGGNFAAALTLRARDEGLALPAAVVLMTPGVDLTESGDSVQTNMGLDPLLTASALPALLLYAGGHDRTDPYVSPLYGDFSKGFPPAILTTGTRDLLLSDTVRMHAALRAAGQSADLLVTEAGGHGGFFGLAPEDAFVAEEIRRFIAAHTTAR
jgi:acetyl esterase/lipase